MTIKWVVFDAMGVIYEVADDVSDLLIPYLRSKNNKTPLKIIYDSYIKASLGKISSKEFWEIMGYNKKYPDIEVEFLDNWYTLDSEFLDIGEKLKENYNLGMLSNDLKEWSNFLRNKYEIHTYFKVAVISGEVGYRKPDKKIYEILLEKTGANPEEIIFVDDKLENLNSASELGIHTIRFIRNKSKIPYCSDFEITKFAELVKVIKNFF